MSGKDVSYKNASGLPDPTAHDAIKKVRKEDDEIDRRVQAFIRAIKTLADQSGYDMLARIEVRDRATGRSYR